MANRYDITAPVADQLRAVRDDYLMATPDKQDTAYAVMTRAADTIGELLEALRVADGGLANVTAFEEDARYIMGNTNFVITREARNIVKAAIAKALGEAA